MKIQQFSVYWCNLEPTFGHQIKKTRPCAIVSPNEMNDALGTVVIVPLTSTSRSFPFYIPVMYHNHKGALACDQIKAIDKRRVGKLFAPLSTKDSAKLSGVLCAMFQMS
ncbi:MAG TPA: type II toxin-antitoxin system PemK/MazF family toxin [Candidatus Binatia bacterium]|nr:type II toxin-antitoxin system PemK/MazF family toxin [Candidatus Binatia bacterium]